MNITYDESIVKENCLKYFDGDELSAGVLMNKYLMKDREGRFLESSPEQMFDRIASEFSRIEQKYKNPISKDEIKIALDKFKYIVPAGSPLFGIGNNNQISSIANCFLIESPKDNYSSILQKDEDLVNIMKRRGGCIEENNFVKIKHKGILKIKDVEVGDEIMSYNILTKKSEYKKVKDKYYTKVESKHQIRIKLSNGFELQTSKKHPILTIKNNEYCYIKSGELKENDVCIIPEKNSLIDELFDYDKSLNDIGWFIGAHTGDGTLGKINKSWNKDLPKGLRLRIIGDNENVVKEYGRIANQITESNNNYSISNNKNYKSKVWQYQNNKSNLNDLAEKYFDNKIGFKSLDCNIFSFVKNNNLFIPYLAGLIDTDGNVRSDGRIDIGICAKDIIEEMSAILSSYGIKIHVSVRKPKKQHWHNIYRLVIVDIDFAKKISYLLKHDKKRESIENIHDKRNFSHRYFLTDDEIKNILNKYEMAKYKNIIGDTKTRNNESAIIRLLKRHNEIGLGGLKIFLEYNLIDNRKYCEILQRVKIVDIVDESDLPLKYIDIEVEGNNNYYAGFNGMFNIHNCGVDLSNLRPSGSAVYNAAKTSDGVTCFMDRYSNTTKEVAQSGRRGALMISLDCRHPDIERFINVKRDLKRVTGANISVKWTDDFMEAVKNNKEFTLRFPVDESIEKAKITRKVNALEIWKQFIRANWESAEPGCLFIDRIQKNSLSDCYENQGFKTYSTNPCGELPLNFYGSCILMSLNLFSFVKNAYMEKSKFDKESFYIYVRMAVRLMDDMVDLEMEKVETILKKIESDPEEEETKRNEKKLWNNILENYKKGRRVGLGVTGLADMLAALGMKYDSDEALNFIEKTFKMFHETVMNENCELAKERGAFPIYDWKNEKDCDYIKMLSDELQDKIKKNGRRNISVTTIAPTGSISLMTQTSSGIEPVFKATYTRRRKMTKEEIESGMKSEFIDADGIKWISFTVNHHGLERWKEVNKDKDIKLNPYENCEAGQLDWKYRVKLQSVLQKYISHSLSSTVNLPKTITEDEVSKIYLTAWEQGCKGLTVYRDGSRQGVLVEKKENVESTLTFKRPRVLECDIHYSTINGKEWIFFVGKLNGKPYDIFGGKKSSVEIPKKYKTGWIIKNGKVDGISTYDLYLGSMEDENERIVIKNIAREFSPDAGAYTRIISVMLRHLIPIQFICEQLHKVDEKANMFSFEMGISRVLKKYIRDGEKAGNKCSKCSSEMRYEGGCVICVQCGYSLCG